MRLHHLAFRTRDLGALTAFYEGALGLSVIKREDERVWLRAGDAVLMLEIATTDEPRIDPRTRELVAFAVDDADRDGWVARLAAAGTVVEDRTQHTLYFRDPDGRRVAVSSHPLS